MSILEATMKMIFVLTIIMSAQSFGFSADEIHGMPDFKNQILEMPGMGRLRISNVYVNEPAITPRRVFVDIQCNGFPEWRKWIAFKIYALEDYKYDVASKKLTLKYVEGRAVDGAIFYDISENPSYSTADVCRLK
jgi:hypothetical protein